MQELTDTATEMHSSESWNPQALAESDLFTVECIDKHGGLNTRWVHTSLLIFNV